MTDLTPNDLSHLSDEEFNALCPQGYHPTAGAGAAVVRAAQMRAIEKVYQAGADQELEACIKWIQGQDWTWTSAQLRAARRPKPPSLKEQALEWLVAAEELHKVSGIDPEGTIRRALESLPND